MSVVTIPTSSTITLAEIMRRPWQALTCQELDALDALDMASSIKQGEKQ